MDSTLLHLGLLSDREKIPVMFFFKSRNMRRVAVHSEKDRELKRSIYTCFKGENLNIQRPKLNYSYVIYLTSESSM
jgi:hypothetical protein